MGERVEALLRIVIGIVSGIILGLWKALIQFLGVINWLLTIISGKRNKGMADFSEIWNTQTYHYLRYMTFVTNDRPFPFTGLAKNITKFKK
jgi:hypothetical protein